MEAWSLLAAPTDGREHEKNFQRAYRSFERLQETSGRVNFFNVWIDCTSTAPHQFRVTASF